MARNRDFALSNQEGYEFFRTTYGPFSNNRLSDIKELIAEKLIILAANRLRLTQKGNLILKKYWIPVLDSRVNLILSEMKRHDSENIQDFIFAPETAETCVKFLFEFYLEVYEKYPDKLPDYAKAEKEERKLTQQEISVISSCDRISFMSDSEASELFNNISSPESAKGKEILVEQFPPRYMVY